MVNSWEELILQETKKPYWDKLAAFIQEEEKHFLFFRPAVTGLWLWNLHL